MKQEDKIEMIVIGNRKIVVRGLGKMFYQDGFPISIGAKKLKESGIDVSWLHVADELLKHGWSPDTVFKKLREDIVDGGGEESKDQIVKIEAFCNLLTEPWPDWYHKQREMIFEYLFGVKSNDPSNASNQDIINIVEQVMGPPL